MKPRVKKFPDELAFQIVQEYLNTEISQTELKIKYNFGGNNNLYRWMRKFGVTPPQKESNAIREDMPKENKINTKEYELEQKIKKLEEELKREQFKAKALNTMIDVAERELKVDIRKKSGSKQ